MTGDDKIHKQTVSWTDIHQKAPMTGDDKIHKQTVSWTDIHQKAPMTGDDKIHKQTVSWTDIHQKAPNRWEECVEESDIGDVNKKRHITEIFGSPPVTYSSNITPTSSPVKKKAVRTVTIMSQGSCS
jgi:hypothetical protein